MPASKKKAAKKPDSKLVEKQLGEAELITMDKGIRDIVAMMFEHDNAECFLDVALEGTAADVPPKIMLKIELISINGVEVNPTK